MQRFSLSNLIVIAGTVSALAQVTPSENAPAAQPAESKPATLPTEKTEVTADAPKVKIICVREPAETGSHMGGGKECHTETEWASIHERSTDTLERLRAIQNAQDTRTRQSPAAP